MNTKIAIASNSTNARQQKKNRAIVENRCQRHGFGKELRKEVKWFQEQHGIRIYGNSTVHTGLRKFAPMPNSSTCTFSRSPVVPPSSVSQWTWRRMLPKTNGFVSAGYNCCRIKWQARKCSAEASSYPKPNQAVEWVVEACPNLSADTMANGYNGILWPNPLSSDDENAFMDLAEKLASMNLLNIAVGEVLAETTSLTASLQGLGRNR
ncbi:unnamed protein product [Phytophthora fragariaefolia]|uniref:Unnamed protein product n=1 Tax=Phytophthora fragariaefolia TaxID=1490495 RepID=A0A9W7D8Q6_9STRA|nr:unnamed protein product [Phytophthora fragariaefolia]